MYKSPISFLKLLPLGVIFMVLLTVSCGQEEPAPATNKVKATDDFQYMTEQFADVKIIRYRIPAWDKLTLKEKKLVYYLTQAGLAGRDIMYDQNYRHNLVIRNTLEGIYRNYSGDKSGENWKNLEIYLKRIWFSNGIHHHYSYDKFDPGFPQKYLEELLEYYQTGDLKAWDQYNIAWVQDTSGIVDYINGFIEVYNDPLGYRGSYESIVQIKDLDASEKMKVLAEHAHYFEEESPIDDAFKKEDVVGISYNFINVAGEAGDASPSTPIGVNLPNADWIRKEYGSKSISLGNIVAAYEEAGTKGFLQEFSNDSTEIERAKAYGAQADKLHAALHEVIGHASGKLAPGVGTPKQTLKNYASTLEEARADLVGLYYLMDPKLIEFGVMDDLDAGRTAYDGYIKNGLMLQLRRLEPGSVIEQDHMRNRQMVAEWVYEKGQKDSVIVREVRDGKTYFDIRDYDALRALFGQLLAEVQRIKSEGDFESGKALVENYGVQVDPEMHREALGRTAKFKSAPYGGFINLRLVPVEKEGEMTDVRVEYPDDFAQQMLEYAEKYSNLPAEE